MLSFGFAALSALVLGPGSALAGKVVQNAAFSVHMYESGAVMEQIMATKMVNIPSNNVRKLFFAYVFLLFRRLGLKCLKPGVLTRLSTHD
jgi:hypothetical protein